LPVFSLGITNYNLEVAQALSVVVNPPGTAGRNLFISFPKGWERWKTCSELPENAFDPGLIGAHRDNP
jgi:hypothetical protein